MAAAPQEKKYPQKLIDHLKERSNEQNDNCIMFKEWYFVKTEDSGGANSNCPCGKKGIRYLCYIENQFTKKTTFVGTSCVEFFDDEMKEVLKLVLNLISCGINGKYKGEGQRNKERFEVRANTNLVTKKKHLEALFNHVPIYQKGNGKWEIQAFNSTNLTVDVTYKMKIKSSRWSQEYGTGISFQVIQIELKD